MDSKRLNLILRHMRENEGDLLRWLSDYKTVPERYRPYMEETFRSHLRIYHELVVKYLSVCNKSQLYSLRDNLRYRNILDLHIENGDIPKELKLFLLNLQDIRNRFSHEYKVPPFSEIYRFYINNTDNFKLLYNTMLTKYQSFKDDKENSSTKQMNLFGD